MELKEAAQILAEIADKNGVQDDYDYNVEELTRIILDCSDLLVVILFRLASFANLFDGDKVYFPPNFFKRVSVAFS